MEFIIYLRILLNYSSCVTGQYFEAAEHFENYYKLAVEHKEWIQGDGLTYHTDACINLSRIYTTIGQRMEEEDQQNSLEYLKKAHKFATESKNSSIQNKLSGSTLEKYSKCGFFCVGWIYTSCPESP